MNGPAISSTATVTKLHAAARVADQRFLDAFEALYAPGNPVAWTFGAHQGVQSGKVERIGHRGRLLVTNATTGATYWIHPAHVMAAQ